ncbi:hypothetical protein BDK92_7076 [Micromonospora pisi]|uniref:Uncharacterized protein n=1 Tax=Micromonospora pisi TaxID=589240 RepID=A0A495JWK4_9ACTN|nr:hypothetical protein [Micromonospora pisi]RKR92634.1 hypothetical protein BDK92_7076 [Micromonospora pisi]
MANYLLGLLTIPAFIAAGFLLRAAHLRVGYYISRLAPTQPYRRATLAGDLFAARRAYVIRLRHMSVALVLGTDRQISSQAKAALLDEFLPPEPEGTASIVPRRPPATEEMP